MQQNRYLFYGLLNLFLVFSLDIFAQNAPQVKGWGIEPSLTYGKIFVHTRNINTPITANTAGFELSLEKKLNGKNPQHIFAKYPQVGLLFNYQNFNERYVGFGVGFSPYINMDFVKYKRFRLYGRLALGIGWLSEHYNVSTNTYNNIVGSHFSNNTILKLAAGFQVNKYIELRPAFHFSHFSNGASQLPNYGINVTSFQLGVFYSPKPYEKKDFVQKMDSLPALNKRFLIGITANLGMRESSTYGGAKYPIYQFSADVSRWLTRLHRFRAGVEYEKLTHVQEFLLNLSTYTQKQAAWQASRISAYGGFEIMWGRFTLGTNVGFYLTKNALQPYFYHFRVTARYYFCNPITTKIQPFIGWGLKTHKIIAEYMSINAGVLF
jgi:Lipid A 3-O-deacylase (PagL)